jgi:hypothetical protein
VSPALTLLKNRPPLGNFGSERSANEVLEVSAPQKRNDSMQLIFNVHFHGAVSGGHIQFLGNLDVQQSMLAQSEKVLLASES